jgi:hypothetical protein
MKVLKFDDAWVTEFLTAVVFVACLALQICFHCSIASTYQLTLRQSIIKTAREK